MERLYAPLTVETVSLRNEQNAAVREVSCPLFYDHFPDESLKIALVATFYTDLLQMHFLCYCKRLIPKKSFPSRR